MYYSAIGILALLILLITNHDVIFSASAAADSRIQRSYRSFLFCIMAYYVTDILWGVLDSLGLTPLLYLDTLIYYLAMASGILLWSRYVIAYLDEQSRFRSFLYYSGAVFFGAMVCFIAVNLFVPIVFWFDEAGMYHAGPIRHIMLLIQVNMFLLSSAYVLSNTKQEGEAERRRLIVGLFGLIMFALLLIQLFFPLLPLYSIGYMLGSCLLRTFVIENEREAYRRDLEDALHREQQQLSELSSAWKLAYTDALTGAGSKLACSEQELRIDNSIAEGTQGDFAVVVFDVNHLKRINDTLGHDAGNRYITDACDHIKKTFRNTRVFRIGGDEFAVILVGARFAEREVLLSEFNRQMEENRKAGRVVISAGMAEYRNGIDHSYERVFKRADQRMYERKEELKRRDRAEARPV